MVSDNSRFAVLFGFLLESGQNINDPDRKSIPKAMYIFNLINSGFQYKRLITTEMLIIVNLTLYQYSNNILV